MALRATKDDENTHLVGRTARSARVRLDPLFATTLYIRRRGRRLRTGRSALQRFSTVPHFSRSAIAQSPITEQNSRFGEPGAAPAHYRGWTRCRLHSPRTERMTEKSAVTPGARSVQMKKKPPL